MSDQILISSETAEMTIKALNEKVQSLEKCVEQQKSWNENHQPDFARDVIRNLRLHGFILLNITDIPIEQIHTKTSDCVRKECIEEAWDINNAPLSEPEITRFKAIYNNGMDRF